MGGRVRGWLQMILSRHKGHSGIKSVKNMCQDQGYIQETSRSQRCSLPTHVLWVFHSVGPDLDCSRWFNGPSYGCIQISYCSAYANVKGDGRLLITFLNNFITSFLHLDIFLKNHVLYRVIHKNQGFWKSTECCNNFRNTMYMLCLFYDCFTIK